MGIPQTAALFPVFVYTLPAALKMLNIMNILGGPSDST
jgi:hypothetical protein